MECIKEEYIKELIDNSEVVISTVFDNTTVVSIKLPSGFVITETSSCLNKEHYSLEIGAEICIAKIQDKLLSLEGYFKLGLGKVFNNL